MPSVIPALTPSITPAQSHDRVHVYPSPPGTVLLIGMTSGKHPGVWVGSYCCPTEDFDEKSIVAMERKVKFKEIRLAFADRLAAAHVRLVKP